MHEADRLVSGIGPLVVHEEQKIEAIQELCWDKDIRHIVLCKGTDRMMGPDKHMHPGEFPLRKIA